MLTMQNVMVMLECGIAHEKVLEIISMDLQISLEGKAERLLGVAQYSDGPRARTIREKIERTKNQRSMVRAR